MAQPIAFIPPRADRPDPDEQIRTAAERHAEAISSALEVLQLLHDRGILELLRGLLGAGDRVIETVAAAADTPESIRAVRNFLLLTKFFGSIPPDVLNSLVQTAAAGAEREKSQRAPGVFELLRRLSNENTRHAAAVVLDLAEAAGKAL